MANTAKTTNGQSPVALVTGTSSGIGMRTAIQLAAHGFTVYATMRSLDRSGPLENQAQAGKHELLLRQLDVTNHVAGDALVAEIEAQHGGIDLLVNNAAIGLVGCVEETSINDFRSLLDTNFFGALAMAKAVIPGMRRRRRGLVLNVGAVAGKVGFPALAAYASSKSALEALSESLRFEMRPFGVNVVCVQLGGFKTEGLNPEGFPASPGFVDASSPYSSLNRKVASVMRSGWDGLLKDPDVAAARIVEIAQSKRPAARYSIGTDSTLVLTMRKWLPETVFESVCAHMFKPLPVEAAGTNPTSGFGSPEA